MTEILLKPLSRPLLRGTAKREGEWVVFACTGYDASGIDAISDRVALELARVTSPDQAVAFVQSHGPLFALPEDLGVIDTLKVVSTFNAPMRIREPLRDILRTAEQFRDLSHAAIDAKRATSGDEAARARITRYATACGWEPRLKSGPETWVTSWLAGDLTNQLIGVRVHIRPTTPGQFQIELLSDTLVGTCFVSLARSLSTKKRLAICANCDGPFLVDDGRQKFCGSKCASRARFERFKERHAAGERKRR